MNTTISKTTVALHTVAIDVLLLTVACLIPAASHTFSLPIYQLNPMYFCLLAEMTLVCDRRNSVLLAILLPVVTMLVVGMPTPLKCICIVAELLTLVGIYTFLSRFMQRFIAVLTAMLCSKVVFYLLKALLLSPAVLIGTSIWLQLSTVLLYALLFATLSRKTK
ncbi:MAG: hypothetical protein IJK07_10455 [Bacteroidales bacterium]|nr:hypothetical protein [Bacteroidales bacterium]